MSELNASLGYPFNFGPPEKRLRRGGLQCGAISLAVVPARSTLSDLAADFHLPAATPYINLYVPPAKKSERDTYLRRVKESLGVAAMALQDIDEREKLPSHVAGYTHPLMARVATRFGFGSFTPDYAPEALYKDIAKLYKKTGAYQQGRPLGGLKFVHMPKDEFIARFDPQAVDGPPPSLASIAS